MSHVSGSVVSVAAASIVQCIAVLRANQCARGLLVWWAECSKRSPSASGVAGFASVVNMWTLSVVPVAFHCATHHVCWWHVTVTVGVSGGLSIKAVQSVTFGPSVFGRAALVGWSGSPDGGLLIGGTQGENEAESYPRPRKAYA